LPRFGLFVFLVVAVVLIVVPTVLVVVDEVVIIIFVIVIVEFVGFVGFVGIHSRQAVPDVGLAFSRLGGGYVDQKCRPHFGHTQN